MIPKIIWTFWNTEELPEFIQRCIETWKFYNPDYEINVMNINNYRKYTNVDVTKLKHYDEKKPQLTSDYIRTCVLKEHGGVWMDASIICIRPIKFKSDTEFFAYYKDNHGIMGNYKYPMIENWFIASSKNNSFIDELYTEFIINTNNYYSMDTYVFMSFLSGIQVEYWVLEGKGYFAMFFSILKTFKKLDQEHRLPKMVLKSGLIDGPLLDGHQISLIGELLCNTDFNKLKTSILKINRFGRDTITKNKSVYDCILKKMEHSDKYIENPEFFDKYMEDLGYSNLDGNFQKCNVNLLTKRLSIIIVISMIILMIIILLIIKK